jgi:glycosyltransferase involved in cell wall biosynthesis
VPDAAIVSPLDEYAIAQGIQRLVSAHDLRKRMSAVSCEQIGSRFTWEHMAEQYASLLLSCG